MKPKQAPKYNGAMVAQLRKQKGMTQSALADGICTPSMLSQIESGKARPSDVLMSKIADKLGVPVVALQNA